MKSYDNIENFLSRMKKLDISKVFTGDISFQEFILLKQIKGLCDDSADSSVQVTEIVGCGFVTPQAVSKTLRSLEGKNYIDRFQNKADRRINEVLLTQSGVNVLTTSQNEIESFFSSVFSLFTEDEQKTFERLNEKFFTLCADSLDKLCTNM